MSDRFESLEEITRHFTDTTVEGIRKGTPIHRMVSEIIVIAAGWGAGNVREYARKYGSREIPWETISDAQLEQYTKSRKGLQKTLAQALLDTRVELRRYQTNPPY